ncbi:MAG TPA: glycolate oxidase subunit GlcF [Caulobacteraceae bacterium]|jgi:glycolate oxidase iron-sulfur subunit
MRAKIAGPLADTASGALAEQVLRACVHCGMCNATCPTYELTGDELDGPRGRIYLMKQVLEGEPASRLTQTHLDRCLTCRACETTCPSGVGYHALYDVAKPLVNAQAPRPWGERLVRWAIRFACIDPRRLSVLMAIGRKVRFALPAALRGKLAAPRPPGPAPTRRHGRRMTLLGGCVQAAAAPSINAANRRVFDTVGIELAESPRAGCCGALCFHTGAVEEGRAFARRNIDAWCAELDAGAEAIIANASGCAAFVRDYPGILADDLVYEPRARRVAEAVRDPVEILLAEPPEAVRAPKEPRVAVHPPCTLRNGPALADAPARLLGALGFEPQPIRDAHMCCGSAGAYSLLQPKIAEALREKKIEALTGAEPQAILTANIGCMMHLAEASTVPVRHWIEAVDEVVSGQTAI